MGTRLGRAADRVRARSRGAARGGEAPAPDAGGMAGPHALRVRRRRRFVQATDPLGHSWRFAYKQHLLVQETNRNGLSFYFAYDGHGQDAYCVRTWGDGGIYDHVLAYDKMGKVTCVTNSLGHTTTYKMNVTGCVTEVMDALGGTRKFEYDEKTLRKVKETDPVGGETKWEYDARGNTTKTTGPDGAEIVTRVQRAQPAGAGDRRGQGRVAVGVRRAGAVGWSRRLDRQARAVPVAGGRRRGGATPRRFSSRGAAERSLGPAAARRPDGSGRPADVARVRRSRQRHVVAHARRRPAAAGTTTPSAAARLPSTRRTTCSAANTMRSGGSFVCGSPTATCASLRTTRKVTWSTCATNSTTYGSRIKAWDDSRRARRRVRR